MFWDCMKALNVLGLSFDLLGHPVMTHLERFRSMWDHSADFCNLNICGCMWFMLSDRIAKSSA